MTEDYAAAARRQHAVHHHAPYAVFHRDLAAMHHVEHFGVTRPTAEIA